MTSFDGTQPSEEPPTGARLRKAIVFGWRQFRRDPGGWIALQLVTMVLLLVVWVPLFLLTMEWQSDALYDRDPLSLVGDVAGSIWAGVVTAALVKGALLQMSGDKPALGPSVAVIGVPQVWMLSSTIAVLAVAADYVVFGLSFVLVIPTAYAMIFVVDAGQDGWVALRSSFGLVRRNLVGNLVLFFGSAFVLLAGALACFVGLFVAIPVITLAYVYAYRVFSQPVAD